MADEHTPAVSIGLLDGERRERYRCLKQRLLNGGLNEADADLRVLARRALDGVRNPGVTGYS